MREQSIQNGTFIRSDVKPTDNISEVFNERVLDRSSKFVVFHGFEFERNLESTYPEDEMLVIRNDVISVLFCRDGFHGDHMDIAMAPLLEHFPFSSDKYDALLEDESALTLGLLRFLVIGGGVAGIYKNRVEALWGSRRFIQHLGYDKPESEGVAETVLMQIRTFLYPYFNLESAITPQQELR